MDWTELVLPNELEPMDTRPMLKRRLPGRRCLPGRLRPGPEVVIASTNDNWDRLLLRKFEGIERVAPTITSFGRETTYGCVTSASLPGRIREPCPTR